MPEAGLRDWQRDMQVLTGPQVGVKGNFAEWYDHLDMGQQLEFSEQIGLTVGNFLALRLICWGSTVQRLGDKTVVQLQTVVTVHGHGLLANTIPVKAPFDPSPTADPGKGPPRTVTAVGGWRQAEY